MGPDASACELRAAALSRSASSVRNVGVCLPEKRRCLNLRSKEMNIFIKRLLVHMLYFFEQPTFCLSYLLACQVVLAVKKPLPLRPSVPTTLLPRTAVLFLIPEMSKCIFLPGIKSNF